MILSLSESEIGLAGELDGRTQAFLARAQRGVPLGDGDPTKPEPLAGLDLAHAGDVEGAHRGDLGIPSRGLSVHQQDDGLPVADHLDAAEGDAVGDDVVAARVLDQRSPQSRTRAATTSSPTASPSAAS